MEGISSGEEERSQSHESLKQGDLCATQNTRAQYCCAMSGFDRFALRVPSPHRGGSPLPRFPPALSANEGQHTVPEIDRAKVVSPPLRALPANIGRLIEG